MSAMQPNEKYPSSVAMWCSVTHVYASFTRTIPTSSGVHHGLAPWWILLTVTRTTKLRNGSRSTLSRAPSPSVSTDRGFVPREISYASFQLSPSVSGSWGSVIHPSWPNVVSSESFRLSPSVSAFTGDVRIVNRTLNFSRIPPDADEETERVYIPPPCIEAGRSTELKLTRPLPWWFRTTTLFDPWARVT